MYSFSRISSRTGGEAVAVRARVGGRPSRSSTAPRHRYSGRKSCPQAETQCASSTTKRETAARPSRSTTSSLANCSGARKTYSAPPCRTASQASFVSPRLWAELTATASGRSAGHPDDLVALRGDERGDHDRWSVQQQRRHLIDRRLAVTGRHNRQHVPAQHNGLHRLQLTLAQPRPAERVAGRSEQRRAPVLRSVLGHRSDGSGSGGVGAGYLGRTMSPTTPMM